MAFSIVDLIKALSDDPSTDADKSYAAAQKVADSQVGSAFTPSAPTDADRRFAAAQGSADSQLGNMFKPSPAQPAQPPMGFNSPGVYAQQPTAASGQQGGGWWDTLKGILSDPANGGYAEGLLQAPQVAQAVRTAPPQQPQQAQAPQRAPAQAPQRAQTGPSGPVRASQFNTGLGQPGSGDGILSYAGQPVLPGTPDTPMDQAMAPQAPDTPLGQAMDPSSVPQQPQQAPSFMDRLSNRQDSKSIYDGLINGGAAMIGAKNLQEGLAGGIKGFNDSYDAKTDKDKLENTPKVTQLADGAFSSVQYPGKAPVILKNSQVASYLDTQKEKSAEAMANKLILSNNLQQQGKVATENRAAATAAQGKLDGLRATVQKFQDAQPAVDRYDTAHRLAAGGGSLGTVISGAVDPQIAIDNQQLTELNVGSILEASKQLTGAKSDQDVKFLSQEAPKPGVASPEVMRDWHKRTVTAMNNVIDKLEAQQARGANGGMPQRSSSSSSSIPTLTSKADFDALPSGSLFKAPDGTTRRKP